MTNDTTSKFKLGEINTPLLTQAVTSLLKYHNGQSSSGKTNLLGDETDINVMFSLLRVPGNPSPNPIRLDIPHPLHKVTRMNDNSNSDDEVEEEDDDHLEELEICIIVKDESKPYVQEMIEKFPNHLGCIKKVLTLTSLRKKYSRFIQKRELMANTISS